MTCWVVIPVKGLCQGKQRLAAVLDEPQRRRLVLAMLGRVAQAAREAVTTGSIFVLGPSSHGLDLPLLTDPGGGLNAALSSALREAGASGASRVIFVAGDLPLLTPRDLELLSLAPSDTIAVAPDRHRTGTNAISLPLPAASGFTFVFGPDSFARHGEEIRRIGLQLEIVESPGLMRDVDEPSDLADTAVLLGD
jgi:2-phospho-L-lactate guanylyltransferase